jgi:hypothetical protein
MFTAAFIVSLGGYILAAKKTHRITLKTNYLL